MTGGTLPEPAQTLWNAHGELLVERLDGIEGETSRWALGGGTILAKRWEHRRSFDLDITISESAPAITTWETATRIGRELEHRGLTVRYDDQNRAVHALTASTDEHGNGGGIDIWIHDPGLPGEVRGERIGAATAPTLSTAQILHGKLQRDQRALIRDAYDIAHARLIDPGALETAVNSLGPDHQRRAEISWAAAAGRMNLQPPAIIGWSGKPAADQYDCGIRAAHAIHDSRWTEVEVSTKHGHVSARTVNAAGEERHRLGPDGTAGKRAVELLHEAGIIRHLQNHYRGADWTARDAVEAITARMTSGTTARVLHTRTAGRATTRPPADALLTAEIPPEPPRVRAARNVPRKATPKIP